MSVFSAINDIVLADRRRDMHRRREALMSYDELQDLPVHPDIAEGVRLPEAKKYPCQKCGAALTSYKATLCKRCKPPAIGRKCFVCGVKFQSAYSDLCLQHRTDGKSAVLDDRNEFLSPVHADGTSYSDSAPSHEPVTAA